MHFSFQSLALFGAVAFTIPSHAASSKYCCAPLDTAATTYPNKCQIASIYANLEESNFTAFFEHVSPTVSWTLMGTHPLAGVYHNRTIFATDALQRLGETLGPDSSSLKLISIVGGGNEEWSVQELHALGICKNGKMVHRAFSEAIGVADPFTVPGLIYDNRFSWTTRWNTEGIVVETRAWFDSALVARAITENESPVYNYTSQRTMSNPGPVGVGCVNKS